MSHLTLSVFGTFQATLAGKPLTYFRSAKVQGLLIYLVLTAPQAHSRERLAALFWPDDPDAIAKRNLRQSLYRLRLLLGDDDVQDKPSLIVTRATIQFNPASDYSLDVADFWAALEAGELEAAVSHYHGDLLPSFTCDSLPFDDWLHQQREEHHRQVLDALTQLTGDSLNQADFLAARQFAQQQLALEPWREEAQRQLMQALASLGERTAALAQYEICRAVLAEELGIEPTAETANLAQRIREAQLTQPTPRDAGSDLGRRLTIPFVGRQLEFETLIKAYQQATRDGLQVVTVQGRAGIGKTRLTQQFLAWAATQGADVLNGRSFTTSTKLPYQPLTHLLRQRLERENAPEDLLSDLWLAQLTRLLPELRDRYPDLPEPTQEENTARQHLFEAITRLIQALAARQPLVLFIDDWHWADTASCDVLHYAAVRWAEAQTPILLLLTIRQEAASESPDLQSWLTQFRHATPTRSLQLSELSQTETAQLIQRLLKSGTEDHAPKLTQFSDWLFTETDGQPLFLTETLKALVAEGLVQRDDRETAVWQINWDKFNQQMLAARGRLLPEVQQIIRGWLDRISPAASKLLTAASVLAKEITFDELCHVAGLEQFAALTALDELLNKQLLLEGVEPSPTATHEPIYSFSHQKVSEMVYAEAGAARRRILHRRAFEAMQPPTATAATAAADCAHHARHAGLLAETIRYSLIAGNEAMALFAVQVAIPHYETAWQVSQQSGWPETISGADRQALYTGLGRAYELAGSWTEAQAIYQAMIAHARTVGATAMECLGLNHLATVFINGFGDQPQALAHLEQARTLAEQTGDQRGLAETEWNLSFAAIQVQNPKLALHHGKRALEIARELGHPHLLARCLTSVAQAYSFLRQWDKALPPVLETHQLYMANGDLVMAANSQRGLGFIQLFSGRPTASLQTLQETLAFSQQVENMMGEADAAWILARAQLECGSYGEAIKLGKRAVEQTHALGHPLLHTMARSAWGIIQRVMDWAAAEKTLLELLAQSSEAGAIGWTDPIPELCALYASIGDWEQAYAYARQVTPHTHDDEPLLPFNLTGWCETEAILRGGDEALARAEVERVVGIVGENLRYQLPLRRSQAVLALWDGDVAQAITHLEAALALAHEMELPGEAWPILGELGKLYAEQNEAAKATQAYGEAAVIIRQLAETIEDEGLREGFLTANSVQSILAFGK